MKYSWLTPELKRILLTAFKSDQESNLVDPEMIPLCNRLNAMAGVCTSMSCVGHKASDIAYLQVMIDKNKRHLMDKVINVTIINNLEVSIRHLPNYGLLFGLQEGLVCYRFANEDKVSKAERLYILEIVVTAIEEIFEEREPFSTFVTFDEFLSYRE